MSKQQVPTHTNKNHEGLIDFISSRHYNNQYKEELKAKLFSDKTLFNEALLEFRQQHYPDRPIEDFLSAYTRKYGSPFQEQEAEVQQPTSNATANLQQQLSVEQSVNPSTGIPESLQPLQPIEAPVQQELGQSYMNSELGYVSSEVPVVADKTKDELQQYESDRQAFTAHLPNFAPAGTLKMMSGKEGEIDYVTGKPKERQVASINPDAPAYVTGETLEQRFGRMNIFDPSPKKEKPGERDDISRPRAYLGQVNRSFYEIAPATMEGVAMGSKFIDDLLPGENTKKVQDYATYLGAQWLRRKIHELNPMSNKQQQSADVQIAGGLAQVVQLMMAAPVNAAKMGAMMPEAGSLLQLARAKSIEMTKAMASRTAIIPSLTIASSEFNEAKRAGADDETAMSSALMNAVVGQGLEQLPMMLALKRLDKVTKGGVVNMLKNTTEATLKGGAEEAATEILQQFYSNFNAQQTYDASRKLMDGVLESGEVGGGTGMILNFAIAALGGKMRSAKTPKERAEIQRTQEYLAYQKARVEDGKNPTDEQGREYTVTRDETGKARVAYAVEEFKLANGSTGLRRVKDENGNFVMTDGSTQPASQSKSKVAPTPKAEATPKTETTNAAAETLPTQEQQTDDALTISSALNGEVVYQGQKGTLKQEGQLVVVETPDFIYELGNIEEMQSNPVQQYGVEPVKSDRDFVAEEDYSINFNGTKYLNRYSDPLAAINYDKGGNAVSVNLETEEGKKRTFRGENAQRIAYEYTLLNKAKKESDKPAAVEKGTLPKPEAEDETTPAVNQVQPTVEPEVIAETPVAEEKPKRSAPDPYKIPLYDEQAKNKTAPAKDAEAPAEPTVEAKPATQPETPAVTKEQAATANETFKVGESSYTVDKSGDGAYVVTNVKTGKVLSPKTGPYKRATEQYEAKQASVVTQEKKNSFIDRVRSLNEKVYKGTKKEKTEAQASLSKLPREAESLGLELKRQKDHNGKLLKTYDVTDKATGKKASIKNTDTPTSTAANHVPLAKRSKPVQDLTARVIKAAREDYRILQGLGLGISKESDIKGALADIEAGKPTNRAEKLISIIESAQETGIFDKTTQEGAGLVRRMGVPIDDLLGSEDGSAASTESPAAPTFGSKSVDDFILSENILNQDGSLNYETLQERLSSNQIGAMQWVYDLTDNDVHTLTDIVNERREQSTGTGEKAEANTGADSERSTGTGGANRGGQVENEANEGGRGHTKQAEHSVAASKFDQDRANIYEAREAIKSRIKEKSLGRLNALPLDLIPEYAALVKTYLQEGVVGVKEIVAKLKADHSALFSSAEDLDSGDIASILKKAGIAPPEATGERKHTKRLLASPDLSEDFKNGITEQDKRYIPTTNELNGAEADAYIVDFKGAELATKDALDLNNEMHPATRSLLRDKLIAYWDKLAIQSLNNGDEVSAELYFDKAETITSAKVERGTVLGQELQAYRFVAGSSPERVLYNTRKEVEKSKKKELKKVEPSLKKKTDAIRKVNQASIAEALEKGNIQAAIRKAMREDGINIASVVRKHYTVADKTGKTLADKIVELSKLDGSEAQKLADLIQKEFAGIATKKKQQLLSQILTPKERLNPKQKKQLHDRIIELSNLGALSDQQMADLYADKMGLPKLTAEQSAKILELAEKVQQAKEGLPKNHAMQALIRYQEQIKGYATSDLLRSIWYANVLSGYSTQMINAFANTNNTIGELYTSTVLRPKSLPFLLNGLMQGYARGRWEALNVIKTGESPIRGGKIAIPSALEGVTFKGGKWNPYNYLKYVQRIMEASDTLSYHGLREMRSFEMAYSKAKEAGISKPTKVIWNEVTEMLYATSERKAEAELKATDEGLKGRDYKLRVYELMEQSRPVKFIEDAHDFASLGTFNHQPLGTLGFLTDSISRITGNVKAASYIVPFTRIISNVANSYLDWTPYGILRAATGRTGNALSDTDANAKYRREFTPEERAKLLIKSGTGILAAVALYALTAPGEDEKEAVIQISATGPGDFKKRQELAETGWQKYSIKIGTTWYSYQNTPLAIPLAAIGHIRDDERFNGKSLEDESFATKVGIQFLSTISFFSEMTFLKGVSEFLGALNGTNPDQAGSYIKRTTASIGKGFIIPNLFTQVSKEMQAIAEIPMKDAPTMLGKIVRDMPIARNSMNDMVNALGEPVYPDTDRITSTTKESPVWELIIEKEAWIGKPAKGSITMIDRDGREAGISEAEYYKLCKLRGQYIKRLIEENLPELQEMSKEEVQDTFTKWKSEATKYAKQEIYNNR